MRCPKCNREMTLVEKFWFCGNDGTTVPIRIPRPSAIELPADHPLAGTIPQLPTPLSFSLAEFLTEPNPYITLHRLTDAAEIITRFFAIVLLSDLLQ